MPAYKSNMHVSSSFASSGRKRNRCGECEACKKEDCGACQYCRDKPKFGGPNTKRRCCVQRKCLTSTEVYNAISILYIQPHLFHNIIYIISWFVLFYTCRLHRLIYPIHLFRAWKMHFWCREESYIKLQAMEIVFSGLLPS